LKHYCESCETLSEDDARNQWKIDSCQGDKIVAMREVVIKDEIIANIRYPYATTLKALLALNDLSDEPRVRDLLMRIFTLGFETGVETKEKELRRVLGIPLST